MRPTFALIAAVALCSTCAAPAGGGTGGGSAGGSGGGSAGGAAGGSTGGGSTGGGNADGGAQCEPFGRWPAPQNSFTLNASASPDPDGLYFPEIQARFPQVDWTTLDRLYIAAGTYKYINIGNLPVRSASRPLIITNLGGQVRIGPAPSQNFGYLFILSGGSHWILTGRYDPDAQTGDSRFPGHRCGAYADSHDTYGILSDDELVGWPAAQNHMGLAVGGGACGYELEWFEVRRSTFAGVRLGLSDQPDAGGPAPAPCADVSVHDLYVHDTGGEGFYFGSTAAAAKHQKFTRMHVYNNRVLRTANEVAQLQALGANSEVDHNVFGFGGLNWRNSFEQDQDNATQFLMREGPVDVHHNIVFGGFESLSNFFAIPEPGDQGGTITVRDNYFADNLWLGIYMGGIGSLAPDAGATTSYEWKNNVFRDLENTVQNGYFAAPYYAGRTGPVNTLFRIGSNWIAPIAITGNQWTGPRIAVSNPPSFVTLTNDQSNALVAPVVFNGDGFPAGVPHLALEQWTSKTASWASSQDVVYAPGALVAHGMHLYRCLQATAPGAPPPPQGDAGVWQDLGIPADDVRLAASSAHAGVGLKDVP